MGKWISVILISLFLCGCGGSFSSNNEEVINNYEFNLHNYPERLIVLELQKLNNILEDIAERRSNEQ